MKNRFFQEMQRIGIKYRKERLTVEDKSNKFGFCPPFSEGQSFAYKFWAIAERYHATDIIIEELPKQEEIQEMLRTYLKAGINTVVVIDNDILRDLLLFDCVVLSDTKVYRRETELYNGRLEVLKGKQLRING